MNAVFSLHWLDWLVIASYFIVVLAIGFLIKDKAGTDKESYFLAGRSLPWWWAGLSIAATTFAADTPLAVTGIIAAKGISGNWLWLPIMGVHAAMIVIFASGWSRSGVVTDAEFISLRYSGKAASWLRLFRAGLSGLIMNCIILGWVLKAMVKIVSPFFHWETWLPGAFSLLASVWPEGSGLGTPSEGFTIVFLLFVVGVYSTLGGLKGVVLTDLIQFGFAMLGSLALGFSAWSKVGGSEGLQKGLTEIYGHSHHYLDLLPTAGEGWLGAVGISSFAFGAYLIVQSFSNMSSDGGGYMMQRLNAAKSPKDAKKAALLFLVIHYLVRVWPWLMVGTAALVLIPIGSETSALNGIASGIANDRESAYPLLAGHLLGPGTLGILLMSLLAAFMSTVDTHINWGASYIVNDLYLRLKPKASSNQQIRVARFSVAGFVLLTIIVSMHINSVEQAWKWVNVLGASLGLPTILRWLWWRVNATSEITAMVGGLITAILLNFTQLPYEIQLMMIAGSSLLGLLLGILFGPQNEPQKIKAFVETVQPHGVWPGRLNSRKDMWNDFSRWATVVAGTFLFIYGAHQGLFYTNWLLALPSLIVACLAIFWGIRLHEEV